jgi:arylsulfatase A-like enzyme
MRHISDKITLFVILLIVISCGEISKEDTPQKPNILFIICDDLNDSVEGMGGHPQALTPSIDRLTSEGVRFQNAHCAAPLCGPSRASLWTGIYPHKSGILGYDQSNYTWRDSPVLRDAITLFEHFSANGYDIFTTGKVFHNNHHTAELVWSLSGKEAFAANSTFGPFPWNGKTRVEHPSMKVPWGLSRFEVFAPLSDVPDVLPVPGAGIPGYKGWHLWDKPFRYNGPNDRDLMPDEKSAKWAVEKLNEDHEKPFVLTVGFMRPHTPWIAPDEFFDMHPLDSVQLPPYLFNDLEDCGPLNPYNFYDQPGTRNRFHRLIAAYPDNEGWRRAVQGYLACVSFVDHQIGKVLDALEASKYADNTIIVFTSDHGFHLGEKNHLHKNTIWEESTRVPLVIKIPGNKRYSNQTCHQPVSLIDLYPTLIDLCDLPESPNKQGNKMELDGESIKGLIMNPKEGMLNGREVVLTAVMGFSKVNIGDIAPPDEQHFTVRSQNFRYVLWADGFEELYDHRNDPHEWHNLVNNEDYQKIKMDLKEQMGEIVKFRANNQNGI